MGKFYLFLLFSFLVLSSCTEENISRDQKTTSTNPTENQVKAFNTVKLALIHYRNNENNFLFAKEKEIPKDSIKWGLAKVKLNENGKAILWVPIANELDQAKHYFLYITVNERDNVENIYFGEYDSSDSCCATYGNKLHLDHLSGTVRIYNINNEPLGSLVYDNGIPKFTKGIGDKIHELAEIIIYPDTFIANWSDWNSYFGSGTTIDTSDLFCPLCGARSTYLYLDQYQNLFCNMCGYGLGSGGGTVSGDEGDEGKRPQKRTDCSGNATTNATNAQNAIKVPDVLANMNFLREYAKGKEKEWSMLIDSYYGSYKASDLKELGVSSGKLNPNANTVYDAHTHSDDKREGYSVRTGPSAGDIQGMFDTSLKCPNLKGTIIVSYDGSEYLLAIDDWNKLLQFWGVDANNPNRELFKSGERTVFKNIDMEDEYWGIVDLLKEKKYNKEDAHDYAMSYLMDKYNTGLKLSKKEKGESSFKEMKTEKNTANEYKPTKCP